MCGVPPARRHPDLTRVAASGAAARTPNTAAALRHEGDEMILEIDTRTISGNVGMVCWQLENGRHVVVVIDAEGTVQARVSVPDGSEARDVFEHPFARLAVPNLFESVTADA